MSSIIKWFKEPIETDTMWLFIILTVWFFGMLAAYNFWPDFKIMVDNMTYNMVGFKEDFKSCQ